MTSSITSQQLVWVHAIVSLNTRWAIPFSSEELSLYLIWQARSGRIKFWMPKEKVARETLPDFQVPIGVIIFRPVQSSAQALENLFVTDPQGDMVHVDFLYAPGRYRAVATFLKSLGFKRMSWERRDNFTVHEMDLEKLPFKSPIARSS